MKKIVSSLVSLVFLSFSSSAFANSEFIESVQVKIYELGANNTKKPIGIITVEESNRGLIFTPDLSLLPEGSHGFHIHENPSCNIKNEIIGGAAGGHYDPHNTKKHLGAYNVNGHLGDLPALYVDEHGQAKMSVLAPRIMKLSEIKNRSLIIHVGGDNQSDKPLPLGGGGARLACGVIE
ncbi:superoxide dismutase [Cu-Zn] SodC [Bartonella sp. F02]|uniref:superoxide dismutase [Cu-Zn] SodC n=1 Tax=Bartonella sp. F02 TaxID=2967262 RepID=UPI0022A99963|nr:superoxide dismutase [Cu-Zn] SodC [Bartonella sp. F02]MCZ2328250.1 superoxide dismutase [Cu-Zn] SodC [Bartonella sp. F02]